MKKRTEAEKFFNAAGIDTSKGKAKQVVEHFNNEYDGPIPIEDTSLSPTPLSKKDLHREVMHGLAKSMPMFQQRINAVYKALSLISNLPPDQQQKYKDQVLRNLDWLLNTFQSVRNSISTYHSASKGKNRFN